MSPRRARAPRNTARNGNPEPRAGVPLIVRNDLTSNGGDLVSTGIVEAKEACRALRSLVNPPEKNILANDYEYALAA